MHIVYRIVSFGAAAFAGISPITTPEPQVVNSNSKAISQSATQPASIGGTACKKVGQIRDFQSQRLICLKVNAKGGSSIGPSLIWVKISSPKSTPKSTTTIVKKTCQDGGNCKVGDRGPGGGLIFYVKADPSSTWEYLELAPTYYDSTITSGLSWHQAPAAADVYKTPTRDDWFLPTYDQLVLAIEELWYLPNSPYDHPIFNDCWKAVPVCLSFWTSTSLQPGLGLHIGPRFEPHSAFLTPRKSNPRFRTESAQTSRLLPVIAIRGVKSNLVSTPVSTSASVTTTSTTSLTKTKLLSASYEVLDATRIKITWNFIFQRGISNLCRRPMLRLKPAMADDRPN